MQSIENRCVGFVVISAALCAVWIGIIKEHCVFLKWTQEVQILHITEEKMEKIEEFSLTQRW